MISNGYPKIQLSHSDQRILASHRWGLLGSLPAPTRIHPHPNRVPHRLQADSLSPGLPQAPQMRRFWLALVGQEKGSASQEAGGEAEGEGGEVVHLFPHRDFEVDAVIAIDLVDGVNHDWIGPLNLLDDGIRHHDFSAVQPK